VTAFAKGYTASKTRADEKKLSVLKWLYQFNVSTQKLLATILDVDERGQYQFFARLRALGIVEAFTNPVLGREQLYRLTPVGMQVAAMHHGYALTRPPTLSHQVLMHDLTVQSAVARRIVVQRKEGAEPKVLTDYISERYNGVPLNGKRPDAMLFYSDDVEALELELSHRNSARIYYNFLSHLKNIRDQHYDRVNYVFTAPKLLELYQRKFAEDEWPVYVVGTRNRLERSMPNFTLKPEHREYFSFSMEAGYFV
jgi:hypothetical protein